MIFFISLILKEKFSEKEFQTKQFVRAISTAVCRCCIVDTKFNKELFLKRSQILGKYIARNNDFELEALFAIQVLDHKLQHPKGKILQNQFELLFFHFKF